MPNLKEAVIKEPIILEDESFSPDESVPVDEPTIVEAVKDYFETCPYLGALASVNVDFLDKTEGSYSIEETPANPVVREFVDGSRECQFLFTFASRQFYSTTENKENIDNLHLYEKICRWLDDNNYNGVLPNLGDSREPLEIVATTGGYFFGVADGERCARYQIQCRLLYKERRHNG